MAWWLFVIRPTTAGMLRAVTSWPARACRRLPIAMGRSSRGMNHSIRTGPGGYLYTYWQEWAAPSYVYLKRCKADDGIHTELLHRWAMQPAFLLTCLSASQPPIWQPLSPAAMLPPARRMRRMTCGWSQKPRTLVIVDDIQANQCLVHAQIPSLWCVHHPSSQEHLRQRPQRQDHQPECYFHHPVQEPQPYVPDLPLGQAGVPKWQWPP